MSADSSAASALKERFGDAIVTADDEGWDRARLAFNMLVDQRPDAVALPGSAAEAAEIVAAAVGHGLRIAPQGSAHNAAPLGSLDGTLLLRFERLTEVRIDAEARSARVEAGARWWDVVPRASELGLAALHGSSPEVNVVGYSLGGGVGWLAREHGLQTNRITAIDVVTADGAARRVDAGSDPDLFWALRGGTGNFGAVTAIEFELLPITELYAGALFFDYERAGEVLRAWHEWTATAPESVTSLGRLMQFPPIELIPEMFRGKSYAIIEAVFCSDEASAADQLAPLRELGAEMDTFAVVPPAGIAELHMDPQEPVPAMSGHALVGELPAAAIDELVAAVGPGTGSPLLSVELRHTGGAMGREPEGAGAVGALPGAYMMFGVAAVMAPEMVPPIEASLAALSGVFEPHDVGRYASFTESPHDVTDMFTPAALERMRAVRAQYDPDGVFRAAHPV